MCGVFFGGVGAWVGGTRSRFNSGYHVTSELSLIIYVHMSRYVSILMLRICYN